MSSLGPNLPCPARLPTMKDIARLAGVHQSTVSLALRDNPEIPVATRQRIRTIAQQIGYHPDPVLDAFNLHRLSSHPLRSAPAIAYINDGAPTPAGAESAARRATYAGARDAAARLGFVLDRFFVGSDGVSPARLNRILHARNIDCVIIVSFSRAIAELPLRWDGLCGLKIESFHVQPAFDVITPDHQEAARLAIAHLRRLGYHRIGMVLTRDEDERLRQLPRAGYLVELQAETAPIELLYQDETKPSDDRRNLTAWIARNRLDAVIAPSDRILTQLRQAGAAVPADLGFACLDRTGCDDQVAGVDVNHHLIGVNAVELIAMRRRINQRGTPEDTSITFVPVSWHDGASAPFRPHPNAVPAHHRAAEA